MKYITQPYDVNGRYMCGSDHKFFGEYANDKNAIRYMANSAKKSLAHRQGFTAVGSIKLYRYTDFYDDNTWRLVYTWNK